MSASGFKFEIATDEGDWGSGSSPIPNASNFAGENYIVVFNIIDATGGGKDTYHEIEWNENIYNYGVCGGGDISDTPRFNLYNNAITPSQKNDITINISGPSQIPAGTPGTSTIIFKNILPEGNTNIPTGASWFLCSEDDTGENINIEMGHDNEDKLFSYDPFFNCPSYLSFRSGDVESQSGTSIHFVYAYFASMCFGPDTPIPTPTGDVLIKDLQVKDTVNTKHGPQQLAAIKSAHTYGLKYVKFSEGCLGEGLPKKDTWISKHHWMSLGYHDNQFFNQGNHSEEQDEKVFLTTHASTFINVIPGITYEDYPYAKEYNLVFDNWTSVDVNGMEATTHHPRNYYDGLHKSEYIDESKWKDNKIHHHNIAVPMNSHVTWGEIIKHKPEDMPLQTFVRKILLWDDKEKLIISPKF